MAQNEAPVFWMADIDQSHIRLRQKIVSAPKALGMSDHGNLRSGVGVRN